MWAPDRALGGRIAVPACFLARRFLAAVWAGRTAGVTGRGQLSMPILRADAGRIRWRRRQVRLFHVKQAAGPDRIRLAARCGRENLPVRAA
jgi:hypothetical protein